MVCCSHVQPRDAHHFLDPTSCHSYLCKTGILHSQALRLNRICLDNENFYKSCKDLEK